MPVAFDAAPGDVMFVVADPGWITGQSYLICAPLMTRVTSLVSEGSPVFPHAGRFASMIERHNVTIFKAGVTFLKAIMSDPANLAELERYDMTGLRVATFCAEPVSPSVQAFGMEHVTPRYINSYWATEHGGIAWTHMFGNDDFPLRPDAHAYPLPWIMGDVWVEDEAGAGADALFTRADDGGVPWRKADIGEKGEIVIAAPYPYLARTIWGDIAGFKVEDGRVDPAWRGDAAAEFAADRQGMRFDRLDAHRDRWRLILCLRGRITGAQRQRHRDQAEPGQQGLQGVPRPHRPVDDIALHLAREAAHLERIGERPVAAHSSGNCGLFTKMSA